MIRVTHLLDSGVDEQVRHIHAALCRQMPGSDTLKLGSDQKCRGIAGATAQLRRSKPQTTIAWGTSSLVTAVLAGVDHILFSPGRFAGPRSLRWIRFLMRRGNVTMVCTSNVQHRLALSHGIDASRLQLIPPGVAATSDGESVPSINRSDLGLDPGTYVILAPGESTLLSGHEHAVWATVILSQLSPSTRLVVQGRGQKAVALPSMPRKLNLDLVTLAEQKLERPIAFTDLLSIADVCLVTPNGLAPVVPVLQAMAGGVPVVCKQNSALGEILQDGHTALTVGRASPRALVQRLLDLQGDTQLRNRITHQARLHVNRHFLLSDMVSRWTKLIRQQPSNPTHCPASQ